MAGRRPSSSDSRPEQTPDTIAPSRKAATDQPKYWKPPMSPAMVGVRVTVTRASAAFSQMPRHRKANREISAGRISSRQPVAVSVSGAPEVIDRLDGRFGAWRQGLRNPLFYWGFR